MQATSSQAAPELDRESRAILALFRTVRAALTLSRHDDVDVGAKRLISALAESGPTRPSDLAAEAQLDLSTVSRHLAALETDGLVVRRQDPDDRRACVVALTDAGRDRLHQLVENRVAVIRPVLSRWDEADRDRLFDLLIRLSDDMRAEATSHRKDRHR